MNAIRHNPRPTLPSSYDSEDTRLIELTRKTLLASPSQHLSATQRIELREIFDLFDIDGDNVINAVELKVALKKLHQYTTEDEAKNMMSRLDSDGDGVVTFEEFCDHFFDFWSNDLVAETDEPKININRDDETGVEDRINRETFCVFDKDGNGYIEIEELRQVVQKYLRLQDETEDFSEERIVDMLHLLDANGDGVIDYKEFLELMEIGSKISEEDENY